MYLDNRPHGRCPATQFFFMLVNILLHNVCSGLEVRRLNKVSLAATHWVRYTCNWRKWNSDDLTFTTFKINLNHNICLISDLTLCVNVNWKDELHSHESSLSYVTQWGQAGKSENSWQHFERSTRFNPINTNNKSNKTFWGCASDV